MPQARQVFVRARSLIDLPSVVVVLFSSPPSGRSNKWHEVAGEVVMQNSVL